MKLQVALDFLEKDAAIRIAKEVAEYADIIQAGIPVNFVEGLQFIRDLKKLFPNKTIYGDLEIWTLEDWEVTKAFEAGADIVQIQAFADDEVIKNGIRIAKEFNKEIAVSFDGYKGDILKRAIEVDKLGPNAIVILWYTTDYPQYYALLKKVGRAVKASIAVGGGLTLEKLDLMLKEVKADIILVGKAIYNSPNPRQIAKAFKERITAASP